MYVSTALAAFSCWASLRHPLSPMSCSHAISRATAAALNCSAACASGVWSVMPAWAAANSDSASCTLVTLAGVGVGLGVLLGDGLGGVVPAAEACAVASVACASASSCSAVATAALRVGHCLRRTRGVLGRLREVAPGLPDVSHRRRRLVEDVAVAVDGRHVGRAGRAELGRGLRRRVLRLRQRLLLGRHGELSRLEGGVAVAAAAGQAQQHDSDHRHADA